MNLLAKSQEVLVAAVDPFVLRSADLGELRAAALASPRQRARICAHPGPEDALHEMFILNFADTYVRPHRNRGHVKSFTMIEGLMDVWFFSEEGALESVHRLGVHGWGLACFLRIQHTRFHALRIRSESALFLETATGPFAPGDTEYAAWAPDETAVAAREEFLARAEQAATRLLSNQP